MNPLDQHLDQLTFLASHPAGATRAQIELIGILPDSFKPNRGEPSPAVTVILEADTYAAGFSMLAFLHDNPGDLAALWMKEILTEEQAAAVVASPQDSKDFMTEASALHDPYLEFSAPFSMSIQAAGLPGVVQGTTLSMIAPSARIGINLFHELTTPDRLSRLAADLHASSGAHA